MYIYRKLKKVCRGFKGGGKAPLAKERKPYSTNTAMTITKVFHGCVCVGLLYVVCRLFLVLMCAAIIYPMQTLIAMSPYLFILLSAM